MGGEAVFAEYDENATWYSDLKPAFGNDKFFFTDELNEILYKSNAVAESVD